MSSPGNFEYRDDSIVARIGVDVPASTLTDLEQVRDRVANIRVEQEAMARASGEWASYLQSMPAIIEQANQAYRNMVTQLERMSYIQQELGGHANVGMQGAPMGGQGGSYSTAAPAGYVDPFSGMPGTGVGGMGQMTGYMQGMMMNDPRMFANMAAQRGGYVNPAQLGLIGGQLAAQTGVSGGTGGGLGQGMPPAASTSPQATQANRNSAAPPDQNNSGQPTTSEPQNIPATPHPDAPAWQQHLATAGTTAAAVLNEARAGGRGAGALRGASGILGAIGRIGGHGGGGDDGGDDGGGGGGGGLGGLGGLGGGRWGSIAKGAGLAGMGLAAAATVNTAVQNAGEQIQHYRNLGAQTGGGAVEGAGFEMSARVMSMNPFITLEQSRAIMQTALRNGYTGKEFDTLTSMMANNLKDMNMSANETMQLFQTTVAKGGVSVGDFAKEMEHLKDLTRIDGNQMSQDERNAAYAATTSTLQGQGLSGKSLTAATEAINEAFSDNQQLKNIVPQTAQGALQNPNFLMMMAQANGVKNVGSPNQVLRRMQQQGVDAGAGYWKTLQRIADMAYSGTGGDLVQGADRFQMIANSMGVDVGSPDDAQELYKQLLENKNLPTKGHMSGARADADKGTIGEQYDNLVIGPGTKVPGNIASSLGRLFSGDGIGAWDSLKAAGRNLGNFGEQVGKYFLTSEDIVNDAQRRSSTPATGREQVENRIHTEGNVQGNVTITIDQQGKVTAPQSVTLTGQQKSVNAGYGSGTLNNPPPGDPSFNHALGPFGK